MLKRTTIDCSTRHDIVTGTLVNWIWTPPRHPVCDGWQRLTGRL